MNNTTKALYATAKDHIFATPRSEVLGWDSPLDPKIIQVYRGTAYCLSEYIVTEYESGRICFEDHQEKSVFPSYFGRSGDGFNATFKTKTTDK